MKPIRHVTRSIPLPGRLALVAAAAVVALAATRSFAGASDTPSAARIGIVNRVQFEPLGGSTTNNRDNYSNSFEDPPVKHSFTGEFQLYGGVYNPVNTSQSSGALGARYGAFLVPQLSMGLSVDWYFNNNSTLGAPGPTLPASVYAPRAVLGDASTQVLPVMAFLQITPFTHALLVPYFGGGAGYEWLFARANDYQNNQSFSATFSNWAWQAWGGIGIPLSRQLRINGEAFYNAGQLGRDLHDSTGMLTRQVVSVDGAGVRGGLTVIY